MSNESLLAAVRAAAGEPVPDNGTSNSQTQESIMAETQNGLAAAPAKIETADALKAAYPALCESIATGAKVEGATAERERIAGIDKLGMKGHEALVAEMKADGTSVEQAAMKLIGAENALRDAQLAGVKSVEDKTGKIVAAPLSDTTAQASVTSSATSPDGWATEYAAENAAGAKLRSEFSTKEDYVAFKQAEAAGKVRILRK